VFCLLSFHQIFGFAPGPHLENKRRERKTEWEGCGGKGEKSTMRQGLRREEVRGEEGRTPKERKNKERSSCILNSAEVEHSSTG
jgi:hypothetical protein